MSIGIIFLVAAAAAVTVELVRGLRAARLGGGEHAIDTAIYGRKLAFLIVILIALALDAAIGLTSLVSFGGVVGNLFAGVIVGRSFLISLHTGVAIDPAFSRADEPAQFWLLIALMFACMIFLLSSVVLEIARLF